MLPSHRFLLHFSLMIVAFCTNPSLSMKFDQKADEDSSILGNSYQDQDSYELHHEQRRQLWDFFTLLGSVIDGVLPDCSHPPIGPLHDECMRQKGGADAVSTGASHSSTSQSTDAVQDQQGEQAFSGQGTFSGGLGGGNAAFQFGWWMALTAASVALALVAINMGQRKNNRSLITSQQASAGQRKHSMSGAVTRRMGAVSALAGTIFPSMASKSKVAEQELAEQRVLEEQEEFDQKLSQYTLQEGPDGIETVNSEDISEALSV